MKLLAALVVLVTLTTLDAAPQNRKGKGKGKGKGLLTQKSLKKIETLSRDLFDKVDTWTGRKYKMQSVGQ